jgi:hypothetical protein
MMVMRGRRSEGKDLGVGGRGLGRGGIPSQSLRGSCCRSRGHVEDDGDGDSDGDASSESSSDAS